MKRSLNGSFIHARGIFLILMVAIGLPIIAACGGGGGGGGGIGGGITFTGNTNPAVITTTNAATLVANVMGYTSTSGIVTASIATADAPPQGTNQARLARQLSRHLRDTPTETVVARSAELPRIAAIVVDETEFCESGSIHITGVLDDNGLGTLTANYNNCRFGDETLNGQSTVSVDVFDLTFLIPTDATFSFPTMTFSAPNFNVDISGSMRLQVTVNTNTERLSVNMVTRDKISGGMTKTENLVIVDVYDNVLTPSSFSETINGRVFDSVHGFVDIATIAPLLYGTLDQFFPSGGRLLLTGAGSSSIGTTAISTTGVKLELDLNGDDTHEIVTILQWVELAGKAGSDLADSDGDGMHNSWEDVHGFDPGDPSDGAEDTDNDGFTNMEEYQNCSDPLVDTSAPMSADLSITKTASPNPGLVGESLTYIITVRNNGPDRAFDVSVTDALPPDMTFDSATPSQGVCNGTASVICNLGTIDNGFTATIEIAVIPTTESTTQNTANVTGGVLDPDTINNSTTIVVTAGPSASVIQAMIDAAVDGDTVLVAPGTYIGSINFLGKAITVASQQGPEVTIIDGNRAGSVVTFSSGEGPTSVLNGFTLQNGFAWQGGGINILGSSPTITNNLIINNRACTGAGIILDIASPVIKDNIIHNNSKGGCSGAITGGGIYIRGTSSAQILDNDISYNSGDGGGGIALFAAGTPTIKNNLIRGNIDGGIFMVNWSDALIVQNLITGNTGTGVSWVVGNGDRGPLLINNTIADNDSAQGSGILAHGFDARTELINNIIIAKAGQTAVYCDDVNDLNPPIFSFNNVFSPSGTAFGGICTDQTGIDGNISADPLFADPLNGDYRLDPASPAIDAGDNTAPDLPTIDIAGNDRVVDGDGNSAAVVDMGAHELTP